MSRDEIIKRELNTQFKRHFSTIEEMKTFLKESKSTCYGFGWNYQFNENGIGMNFDSHSEILEIEFVDETLVYKGKEIETLLVQNVLTSDSALGGLFQ